MSLALGMVVELFELVVLVLGSVSLSLAGLYVERLAVTSASSGNTVVAVWATLLGGLIFVFAYLLATDKAASQYAAVKRAFAESGE